MRPGRRDEKKKRGEEGDVIQALKGVDTRTHVVGELYDTERSYVESLQVLVNKYLEPLKGTEGTELVDSNLVEEIFYQIPAILAHHESFLAKMKARVENWDVAQKVGDIMVETFTKQEVIDTYTAFINNWKHAKEAIKISCQQKPAFEKFIMAMAREHKGKLTMDCALDSLLIMPVQRIPRYELLLKMLLKHTDSEHPDHEDLLLAQKEVHSLALKINQMEKAALEWEAQQAALRELESLIDGLSDLAQGDRSFIRYDLVTMPGSLGTRKERCLFLFNDLLVISSIKRRSGNLRKPFSVTQGNLSALEGNKYKMLMRIPLDDLDIIKAKDENLKKLLKEVSSLEEDISIVSQMMDLTNSLHCSHASLDDSLRELSGSLHRQLAERQTSESHLLCLDLTITTQEGLENISVTFLSPEKRAAWEEAFLEAKQLLALADNRRPPPEFLYPLPIRKTRAGLQFTCAAPTLGLNAHNLRDVWVCNSDGYVGQVCVLSLQPEPTVMSCNGVCNSRILAVSSIPAAAPTPEAGGSPVRSESANGKAKICISVEDADQNALRPEEQRGNIELDSSDSSEEEDEGFADDSRKQRGGSLPPGAEPGSGSGSGSESESPQPTMWIGTEDGNIHVYNCSDNIRIKKNKIKIQHGSSVHSIVYLDNKVFTALANGTVGVYRRDPAGGWDIANPEIIALSTAAAPVTRMVPAAGKLWCACQNQIKVLNITSLQQEHSFVVHPDQSKAVGCMSASGLSVWISLAGSSAIKLYHAATYEPLYDVNIVPTVNKMLAGCDEIIRAHKAACLRVTALLACKDLLWIGTSAGVLLNVPLPHLTTDGSRPPPPPNVTGIPHGHTGHVRFLTAVETVPFPETHRPQFFKHHHHRFSFKGKEAGIHHLHLQPPPPASNTKMLVISGGDGYEDFRSSAFSDGTGRDDSTNHLLLWHV
ncbi:unnamed protein product [Darwinula stevensoni]|uniref:DH domain-containing protein n=1 Tax=Darwinula stevensoni TaxID=69355 RepID=A0A7R9ABJ4_9CRUS|nr:unnamed protein product [Darwinula stevensoni]CAG0899490.1 unnamed protein product [Darwinula stevensoni]